MRTIFLFLSLLSLLISCKDYNNERECERFRTGRFEWKQESKGELLTSTFTRTENLQIETYKGVTDTSRIEWVNDCEYRVIPINPKRNADSRAFLFKIMQTKEDSYTFEFTQSGRDDVFRGEAKKIK